MPLSCLTIVVKTLSKLGEGERPFLVSDLRGDTLSPFLPFCLTYKPGGCKANSVFSVPIIQDFPSSSKTYTLPRPIFFGLFPDLLW